MTSVDLQDLLLDRMKGYAPLTAIVGEKVYDQVPADVAEPYITMGPADFIPDDADCIIGRQETVQIDIWHSDQGRKWPCKKTVDAVKAALHDYDADLDPDALVSLRVIRARVFEEPDGIRVHGVVQVTAIIEEA